MEENVKICLPVGMIMCYPNAQPPQGWLVCDGSEYQKKDYPVLAKILEQTFACQGDSPETFRVPDLQGQFVRGLDFDGNIDPEREIGSYQEDAFQGHSHKLLITDQEGKNSSRTLSAGDHCHKVRALSAKEGSSILTEYAASYVTDYLRDDSYGNKETNSAGNHTHQLPTFTITEAQSSKYGMVKPCNETRPKNVALLYCIKAY